MLSSSARSTICRLFCIFWYQPYPAKMYHTINPVIRTKFLNPSLRQFPLFCSFLYRHIFKHSKPPTKYSLYIIGGWPNNINKLFLARFLKLLASNAIFRKIAYFRGFPLPWNPLKCLLVICPQTPEIVSCGDGCAFRWNAGNPKKRKLIAGIFACLAAAPGKKERPADSPHWPWYYEVPSYQTGPAYRQHRLSVSVPADRHIPPGAIWYQPTLGAWHNKKSSNIINMR